MTRLIIMLGGFFAVSVAGTTTVRAAVYRVMSDTPTVEAGQTARLWVEAQTESGDNTVGQGYFSFAIDLALTGDGGSTGQDISNILINSSVFDDVANSFLGIPVGDDFVNVAAVTRDFVIPNPGAGVGDLVALFSFDLSIPDSAAIGSMITIGPREGFLENLILNQAFDNVMPQYFEPVTLTVVVPEPATLLVVLVGVAMTLAIRPGPGMNQRACVASRWISASRFRHDSTARFSRGKP